jgi:tRNA threonylcarbamoyladenosine biosynthesis protein TsaE
MIYETNGPEETRKLAQKFASEILNLKTKTAKVVALEGELGAGKTVFVQGLAEALGVEAKIKSPTFVLMKSYEAVNGYRLYHLDCYRLRDEQDLIPLEIEEILSNPTNIVLIEWADRVSKILPEKHIKIHIDHINENTRKVEIK